MEDDVVLVINFFTEVNEYKKMAFGIQRDVYIFKIEKWSIRDF